jgi:hypothetical protein
MPCEAIVMRLDAHLIILSSALNLARLRSSMASDSAAWHLLRLRWVLLALIIPTVITGCASHSISACEASNGKLPLLVITSPRHPKTFDITGNDKLSQELRWDAETQTLSAFVTYSLVSGGGDADLDPANYRVLQLPFPGIKLDKDSNLFVLDSQKRKLLLGHLYSGIFGTQVVLTDNVRLSAHRRDRELSGKLIVSAE